MIYCRYCDPKYYVVYGFCFNCKRRCQPPSLFDPWDGNTLEEWDETRRKWNMEGNVNYNMPNIGCDAPGTAIEEKENG